MKISLSDIKEVNIPRGCSNFPVFIHMKNGMYLFISKFNYTLLLKNGEVRLIK